MDTTTTVPADVTAELSSMTDAQLDAVIAGLEAQEPAMAEAIKAYEQEVAQITAEGEQELAAIDKEVDAKEVEFNAMAEQEVQDETRSDIASL